MKLPDKSIAVPTAHRVIFWRIAMAGNVLVVMPGSFCFGVSGYWSDTSPAEELSMLVWWGIIPMVIGIVNVACLVVGRRRRNARLRTVCAAVASCGSVLLMGIVVRDMVQDWRGINQFKDPLTVTMTMLYASIVGTTIAALWMSVFSHAKEGSACVSCGYDLTGNASGVCPECGCAAGRKRASDTPCSKAS